MTCLPRRGTASSRPPRRGAGRVAAAHGPLLTARLPTSIEADGARGEAAAGIVASFDGLGEGFEGPQGTAALRNPSDNSLAVGPNHIVQIVNTQMAVFTKKGEKFDTTGKVLYGPVTTNNVFSGFGECGELNNGDAVVRYDQLADRWLIVMPIFRRLPREERAAARKVGRRRCN